MGTRKLYSSYLKICQATTDNRINQLNLSSSNNIFKLLSNDLTEKTKIKNIVCFDVSHLSGRNMIAEGYLFKAERLCRKFLKVNKTHVEGMRLLADLGVKADVLDDAEFILEKI